MDCNNEDAFLLPSMDAVNAALELAVPLRPFLPIHHAIRYSLLSPSPRIHPFLCISSCELFGESQLTSLPAACALEMIHAASLIHDDLPCMDDDDLRQGKPSNHKVFGVDMAILAGDALYALAVEHIAKNSQGVSGDRILRVIAELSRTVGSEGMVAGQFLDLTCAENPISDVEKLKDIHLRKTAVLFQCSTVCGAILGGANDDEIDNLRQYGRALGLLYHVVDDVLECGKLSTDLGISSRKAASADRGTYPKFLGLDKSKELAEELRCRAKAFLTSFDNVKAAPLLNFVDFVAGKIGSVHSMEDQISPQESARKH